MIYFIQAGEDGPIKIGYTLGTANFKHRFRMLQTGNHEKLRLRALVEGGPEIEICLHQRFEHHRYRGEWFNPEPVNDYLEEMDNLFTDLSVPASLEGHQTLWTT